MDVELIIVLGLSFFGLIFIVVIALWNVSNRIDDKIGNLDTFLGSKFDLLIDKISSIATDISVIKELSRSIKSVDFQLEHSGITGIISTRPDEFTSELLSYIIRFSEPINNNRILNAIKKLTSRKFMYIGASDRILLFKIRSVDLDENALLIKTFLEALDNELSEDRSKEITKSIEDKLSKIL